MRLSVPNTFSICRRRPARSRGCAQPPRRQRPAPLAVPHDAVADAALGEHGRAARGRHSRDRPSTSPSSPRRSEPLPARSPLRIGRGQPLRCAQGPSLHPSPDMRLCSRTRSAAVRCWPRSAHPDRSSRFLAFRTSADAAPPPASALPPSISVPCFTSTPCPSSWRCSSANSGSTSPLMAQPPPRKRQNVE